jgi:hypothetical protein
MKVFQVQFVKESSVLNTDLPIVLGQFEKICDFYKWTFWHVPQAFDSDENGIHTFVIGEYNEPNLLFKGPTAFTKFRIQKS